MTLLSRSPFPVFGLIRLIATYTYFAMLSGPYLIHPATLFTNIRGLRALVKPLQDTISASAGQPDCSTPNVFAFHDLSCNFVLNAGASTVILCILLVVTTGLSLLSRAYFKELDKYGKDKHTHFEQDNSKLTKADRKIKVLGTSFGIGLFVSTVDSCDIELLPLCLLHFFHGGVSTGSQIFGLILTILWVILYLCILAGHINLAITARQIVPGFEQKNTLGELFEEKKRLYGLGVIYHLRWLMYGCYQYVARRALFTSFLSRLLSPAASTVRSLLLAIILSTVYQYPLVQLIGCIVIDICMLGYTVWKRSKLDRLDWFMDIGNLSMCIIVIIIKMVTLIDMGEDTLQEGWGLALAWILWIYYTGGLVYLFGCSVYILIQEINHYCRGDITSPLPSPSIPPAHPLAKPSLLHPPQSINESNVNINLHDQSIEAKGDADRDSGGHSIYSQSNQ
jgi:hypothetical protein